MKHLRKILLVDDDEVTNFINADHIANLNVADEVEVCSNGREAIEHIIKQSKNGGVLPELILLDINMPEMDGFAFLEALNHFDHPSVKDMVIIMLTTSLRKEDIEAAQAYENMVSDYIEKPLTTETVIELIQRHFH